MKRAYLLFLLMLLCAIVTHAQDSLFGNWITHYYKTEKREIKCQDKFDADKLILKSNGIYVKQYFLPLAADDAPLHVGYDWNDGKKKYFNDAGDELKLIKVRKVQENGRYKVISSTGQIEFSTNNEVYTKRIQRKGQNLLILDSLDNRLFIRVYKRL
ncbi:MAG TPA: hypothetical protein VIM65_14880 [Cyclobacteriaceae bacterium]